MKEAKKYEHLPLDDEEDDENHDRPSSSEGLEDSDDSERDRSPIRKRKSTYKKKGAANQANYTCMQGGTGIAVESNPNGVTISILEESKNQPFFSSFFSAEGAANHFLVGKYYSRIKDP